MAREHEVISPEASVPVGIFGGDDADVICDRPVDGADVKGLGLVDEPHHLNHAEGKKMNMRDIRVPGSEPVPHIHVVYEPSFHRVYASARPVVEQRRLPFFVHINLEQLLHLKVAPVECNGIPIDWACGNIIFILRRCFIRISCGKCNRRPRSREVVFKSFEFSISSLRSYGRWSLL